MDQLDPNIRERITELDLNRLTTPVSASTIFKSGVSFSASRPKDALTLMVHMPYFDFSTNLVGKTESLSLSEYRVLESGMALGGDTDSVGPKEEVLVHQTWFMVFDDGFASNSFFSGNSNMGGWDLIRGCMELDTIAMFRSAEDKHSDPTSSSDRPRPIYPHQDRIGVFRALVQMISNIFTTSRRRPLVYFRQQVSIEVRFPCFKTLD